MTTAIPGLLCRVPPLFAFPARILQGAGLGPQSAGRDQQSSVPSYHPRRRDTGGRGEAEETREATGGEYVRRM
jgi:hypothetical protein